MKFLISTCFSTESTVLFDDAKDFFILWANEISGPASSVNSLPHSDAPLSIATFITISLEY